MYYHSRELRHVEYGKVGPPPVEAIDPDFLQAYRWLACRCGFFPQVWLTRGSSRDTGFRDAYKGPFRKSGLAPRRRQPSDILFGFDIVKGFPVDMDLWCMLLNTFLNAGPFVSREESDRLLAADLDGFLRYCHENDCIDEVPAMRDWEADRHLGRFLKRRLFVEGGQVVVPALNLKAAKRVVCRNERQRRALRRMGFIEDRIEIRNVK